MWFMLAVSRSMGGSYFRTHIISLEIVKLYSTLVFDVTVFPTENQMRGFLAQWQAYWSKPHCFSLAQIYEMLIFEMFHLILKDSWQHQLLLRCVIMGGTIVCAGIVIQPLVMPYLHLQTMEQLSSTDQIFVSNEKY